MNIEADEEDVKMLVYRYDGDRDGRLSFFEFWDLIAPLRKEYAILLAEREPIYVGKIKEKGINGFRQETKLQICELLNLQLTGEREIEYQRSILNLDPNENPFSLFRLFQNPDMSTDDMRSTKSMASHGKLNKKDIRQTFQKAGYWISSQELTLLFARFHSKK
jgi:hypothetical protein